MTTLQDLRDAMDRAGEAFDAACEPHYCDGRWGYYRAVERDQPIPAGLHEACDAYIEATHAYYLERDGHKGFLGSRGL